EDHLHLQLRAPRHARAHSLDRLAAPKPLAVRGLEESDREAPEPRFAASRFADEPDDLALADTKIDVVDGADDFFGRLRAERVADLRRDVERFDEALRDAVQLEQRQLAAGGAARRDGSAHGSG